MAGLERLKFHHLSAQRGLDQRGYLVVHAWPAFDRGMFITDHYGLPWFISNPNLY